MLRNRLAKARSEAILASNQGVHMVPISQLRSNPRNVRTHPKKQVSQLAKAIEQFGIITPVIVDSDNMILSGHGRIEALKLLGGTEIPTLKVDHLPRSTRTNVWNYPGVNTFRSGRMDELQMHPTVKPMSLVVDAMKDCSSVALQCLTHFWDRGRPLSPPSKLAAALSA